MTSAGRIDNSENFGAIRVGGFGVEGQFCCVLADLGDPRPIHQQLGIGELGGRELGRCRLAGGQADSVETQPGGQVNNSQEADRRGLTNNLPEAESDQQDRGAGSRVRGAGRGFPGR